MTDTSSVVTTQSASQFIPVTASSLASPTINGSLSDTIPAEEDEPYTIKCICAFQDDDGNTVFCEKCETWQHIECYYHGKKVPEVHNCADCEPRPLDAKRATERQRRLREQTDGGDRKAKRPSSKSHKKKIKDNEQTNGWHSHDRRESLSASREQPPAKRPKTSHRPSGSVSSMNGAPVLIADGRKRAYSSAQSYPSPTKSPLSHSGPVIPQYSTEFLQLYEMDQGKSNLSITDNFNTLNVTGKLRSWLEDPESLSQETGRQYHEVFIQSDAPLNPTAFPNVSLQTLTNPDIEVDGKHPSWQILRLESDVGKDDLVGEIKGSVGLLEDYCHDEANRWAELRHPEPFVFFHPQLPIYIDSRREGTKFRYLRRSCRPNVTMKTYIDSEGEYHYCFVAKDDIPAGAELTAIWYLDQTVLNRQQIKEEHPAEGEHTTLPLPWVWASRVLANFGDCACDSQQQTCMLAPLDHRKAFAGPDNLGHKHTIARQKKLKSKRLSPPTRGRGSVSRAESETIKAGDDDDQFDTRSTSGSVRSKPQSRDMTPTNVVDNAALSGLTDREKRKIAAAEKTFERLEQDLHVQKKKKRSSGGSTLNTPSLNTTKHFHNSTHSQPDSPSLGSRPSYVDASTSRDYSTSPPLYPASVRKGPTSRKTSAPNTPALPSPLRRPTYVDSAVQTEMDNIPSESTPDKKRKFTTLTQRLLKRCHSDRVKFEELEHERHTFSRGNTLPSPISPSTNSLARPSSAQRNQGVFEDVEMKDVEPSASVSSPTSASSPTVNRGPSAIDSSLFSAPPLPSQAAHTRKALPPINGYRLQLSSLPPIPTFSNPVNSGTPITMTPGSAQQQSPYSLISTTSYLAANSTTTPSAVAAPSPVKKKLSLGDYMSRRNATPAVEKTSSQLEVPSSAVDSTQAAAPIALQPSQSLIEEAKAQACLETDSAIEDDNISIKNESALGTIPEQPPTAVPSDDTMAVAAQSDAVHPPEPVTAVEVKEDAAATSDST